MHTLSYAEAVTYVLSNTKYNTAICNKTLETHHKHIKKKNFKSESLEGSRRGLLYLKLGNYVLFWKYNNYSLSILRIVHTVCTYQNVSM